MPGPLPLADQYVLGRRCPSCRYGYISADQFLCVPCEQKATDAQAADVAWASRAGCGSCGYPEDEHPFRHPFTLLPRSRSRSAR